LVRVSFVSGGVSADRTRDLRILARDQRRRPLDNRHLGADAAVHLRELEPDVAAADDDQVPRHAAEFQYRRAGEVRHLGDAGHVRARGAGVDV
jgi:hypothetical protein